MSSPYSWSQWGILSASLTIALYFFYHAFYGQRGFVSWKSRQQEFLELQSSYVDLKKEHDVLARKVRLMQTDIDPDVLTQQAWIILRYVEPNSYVIFEKND